MVFENISAFKHYLEEISYIQNLYNNLAIGILICQTLVSTVNAKQSWLPACLWASPGGQYYSQNSPTIHLFGEIFIKFTNYPAVWWNIHKIHQQSSCLVKYSQNSPTIHLFGEIFIKFTNNPAVWWNIHKIHQQSICLVKCSPSIYLVGEIFIKFTNAPLIWWNFREFVKLIIICRQKPTPLFTFIWLIWWNSSGCTQHWFTICWY